MSSSFAAFLARADHLIAFHASEVEGRSAAPPGLLPKSQRLVDADLPPVERASGCSDHYFLQSSNELV